MPLHIPRASPGFPCALRAYVPAMTESTQIATGPAARRLRLDTLVRLRWFAVTGQSIAVAGVHFGLGFPLPFGWCFVAIAVSAWLNVALRIRYPMSYRLSENAAMGHLAYDIVQLAVLLYLTGGLENPFSLMFLAPVMISATALLPRRTLALGLFVVACATILLFEHMPLPWYPGEALRFPAVYVVGSWTSILLGLAFIAVYAWRVAEEARALANALTATELVLAREQHLSQLDGLAAAAAHELGTPLATIALVAKELDRATEPGSPMAEDIKLLRDQVSRCRDILGKLTSLSAGDAGPLDTLSFSHLIEEITSPQRPFGVPIRVERLGDPDKEPTIRRNPGVIYGLGNLVDNAVDFAAGSVTVEAFWDEEEVALVIRDDGPGFAPDVLLRMGEPYITTRGLAARGAGRGTGNGLGLGLFIAKTLLERSGATLTFSNAQEPERGAVVQVEWPRDDFERNTQGAWPASARGAVNPPESSERQAALPVRG